MRFCKGKNLRDDKSVAVVRKALTEVMMLTLIILATIVMQNSHSIVVPDNLERRERAGEGERERWGEDREGKRERTERERSGERWRGGEREKERGMVPKKLRISMNLGMQEEEGGGEGDRGKRGEGKRERKKTRKRKIEERLA